MLSFCAITGIIGKLGLDAVLSSVLGASISDEGGYFIGQRYFDNSYGILCKRAGQLHSMYDSTYVNPLYGEPEFLWMFYGVLYIYIGIGSSFTWSGYTNTGSVAILPYVNDVSENPAFAVVAAALSGTSHDISGKIGWNSWGTES